MPSISPCWQLKLIGWGSAAVRRFSTVRCTGAEPATDRSPASKSGSTPAISRISDCSDNPLLPSVSRTRPSRSTVTRSQTASTSRSRWEM